MAREYREQNGSKRQADRPADAERAQISGQDTPRTRPETTELELPDFGFIHSAEFAQRDYSTNWLVDSILADGQPCIIAGPSKTLKTSVLVELGVSVASGKQFFNEFNTRQAIVAIVSAESGPGTLQETAIRVCESKGVRLAELEDRLLWAFTAPQIGRVDHMRALEKFVIERRVEVIIIDPAYLAMSSIGESASNQFVVGETLMALTRLHEATGVLPVLAAHTTKNKAVGEELELSDIAYAGFSQWARQWFLLNRREKYDRERPGSHKLFLSFGGSAGHSGSWALDIEEGDIRTGRTWKYARRSAAVVCRDAAEAREEQKEKRKRDTAAAQYEVRRRRILKALQKLSRETASKVRDTAGLRNEAFAPVWADLLQEGTVGLDGTIKRANGQEYDAFTILNARDKV